MVILGLLICLICLITNIYIYRDLTSPPLILSYMWVFIHVLLISKSDLIESPYFLSFGGSLVFFSMSFFIFYFQNKKYWLSEEKVETHLKYHLKQRWVFLFAVISTFITLFSFIDIFLYVQNNFVVNFWQSINYGRGTGQYKEFFIFSYSRFFLISFSLVVLSIFYKENKFKVISIYLVILTSFSLFLIGNRSILFMYIIAILFQYIFMKKLNNMHKIKILFIIFLAILAVFSIFNLLKFAKDDSTSILLFMVEYIEIYFGYSLIGFTFWVENFTEYLYGANTLKFFYTILISLGFDLTIESNVQEYISIGETQTNVYSILEYYTQDFGLLYAFLILGILGGIYGILYKLTKNRKDNLVVSIILALLYYPLIYQFFGDQYFSVLSTWIQLILWILILDKLLVVKNEVRNE